jgi:hypothetical protein
MLTRQNDAILLVPQFYDVIDKHLLKLYTGSFFNKLARMKSRRRAHWCINTADATALELLLEA